MLMLKDTTESLTFPFSLSRTPHLMTGVVELALPPQCHRLSSYSRTTKHRDRIQVPGICSTEF